MTLESPSSAQICNSPKQTKENYNIPYQDTQLTISFNNTVHRHQLLAITTPVRKSKEQNTRNQKRQTKKFIQDQCWWGQVGDPATTRPWC
jgi:hypothetical protein